MKMEEPTFQEIVKEIKNLQEEAKKDYPPVIMNLIQSRLKELNDKYETINIDIRI